METGITRRRFVIGLGAMSAATMLASCGVPGQGAASDTILFGVSGPFSGNNAEYGRIWKKAFAMALAEINDAGGVKGRKVDLVYEDTQADPKQSAPVAQKFVDDKRILAELGDFSSPASMAASKIYQQGKMVQFGFTNSHPDFTKGGDFMFSTSVSQQQDAAFLAQTGIARLGKRQAVLYRNTDWGKVTNSIYTDTVKQLGGEIVANENFLETETDFRALLVKVRDTKPDVLTLIAYYNDGALLTQQARQAGITDAKILVASSCYSPQFLTLGGDATNGVTLVTTFFPDSPRPEVQKFVADYQRLNNEAPDNFAAGAYDAVKILAWAAERGGADRVGIQQALKTGTDIPSIIFGPFKFGDDRRVGNVQEVQLTVKDGRFTPLS